MFQRFHLGDRVRVVSAPRDKSVDGSCGRVTAIAPGQAWQSLWVALEGQPRAQTTEYFRVPNDELELV
jgi:hypothetical protein